MVSLMLDSFIERLLSKFLNGLFWAYFSISGIYRNCNPNTLILAYILYYVVISMIKEESKEIKVCPECGSTHVVKHGIQVTRKGKFQMYQCRECARVFY
jgi:transposase-like protein